MTKGQHWKQFLEFAHLEISTGGPDPHLKIAAEALRQVPDIDERIWRAACYVGPYEVSTGSVIWSEWPLERVLRAHNQTSFCAWIEKHWKKFCIRRERRAARTPKKMSQSLLTAAAYARRHTTPIIDDYDKVWAESDRDLLYFGRYALIKFLETLHRGGVMQAGIPDIRPKGGWSPRTALAMIYDQPDDKRLIEDNHQETLDDIQSRTDVLLSEVKAKDRRASHFDIEVLLCNYRQAILRKYPGRPQDTDLAYYYKTVEAWGKQLSFPVLDIRKRLFPAQVLGELNGWNGPREDLGFTYSAHGYFWSDLLYDFHSTKDLGSPVRRNNKRVRIL